MTTQASANATSTDPATGKPVVPPGHEKTNHFKWIKGILHQRHDLNNPGHIPRWHWQPVESDEDEVHTSTSTIPPLPQLKTGRADWEARGGDEGDAARAAAAAAKPAAPPEPGTPNPAPPVG